MLDGMEGAPVELQRLLRRVLEPETRTYRAEGSEKESTAQCRFIGLFNVDPSSLIRQQKLLPDFLERFSIKLHIPPLRERKDDIPRLARHLASRHMASMGVTTHADQCMPSDAVIDEWCARDWQNESGNVRGLRTAVIEYVEGKLHELSVHPHTEHVLLHQEPKRGRPCLMDDTQLGMILRNAAHNGLCWADLKANLTTSHGKPICQSVRALKQRMRRNQVEVTPEVKRYLHGLRVDEGAR